MSKVPNFFRFLTEPAESTDCPVEIECLNGTKYCWIYEIIDEVYEKMEALKRGSCTPADIVKNQVVIYEIIIIVICIIDNCCNPDPPPSESEPSVSEPPQRYRCEDTGSGIHCVADDNGPYDSIASCEAGIAAGDCGTDSMPWLCNPGTGLCEQHPDGTFDTQASCSEEGCASESEDTRWDCDQYGNCFRSPDGPYGSFAECKQGCVEHKRYRCDRSDGTCKEDPNGPYATLDDCERAIAAGLCSSESDSEDPVYTYDCIGTDPEDPHCYEIKGDGGRWNSWDLCNQNKDKSPEEGGCKTGEPEPIPCCPTFPGQVLVARITYGKKGTECIVEHPIHYQEPGPGQKLHCWLPDRVLDCVLMECNPMPECCLCQDFNNFDNDWECVTQQTYLSASLCCSYNPLAKEWQWEIGAEYGCRFPDPVTGLMNCEMPPLAAGGFAGEPAGSCFPMDAVASGELCSNNEGGLRGGRGKKCCPIKVEIFAREKNAMLDRGGQFLVDSNELTIDEESGVGDITEGTDGDVLLDSGSIALIELSGPIGLEDSDGTHLFDSGLPTQFPLLEG